MNSNAHKYVITDTEKPFDGDPLGLEICANNLTSLITAYETPLVLTVSAPWGQGKTTFLEMWLQDLENKNIRSVYYDAWKHDYCDDPLMSFFEVFQEVVANSNIDEKAYGGVYEKLKDKMRILIRYSAKPATRFAFATAAALITGGDPNAIKAADAAAEIASNIVDAEIQAAQEIKDVIGEFRSLLIEFAETVTSGHGPLVIVVDELDRCRPDYTIELLEKIKHLMSVPGICFILSVDRERLAYAAANRIGFSTTDGSRDPDGYLRRFIDLDFYLPTPKSRDFLSYCISKLGVDGLIKDVLFNGAAAYGALAQSLNLSLREQIQVVSRLKIVGAVFPGQKVGMYILLAIYTMIAFHDRKIVEQALRAPYEGLQDVRRIINESRKTTKDQEIHDRIRTLRTVSELLFDNDTSGRPEVPDDEIRRDRQRYFGDPQGYGSIAVIRQRLRKMMEFSLQFSAPE